MNLKAKMLMRAKAISVWWGIYLILGCCAGFSLKVLWGFLFVSGGADKFDVGVFVPLIIAGSFILAVLSYIISLGVQNAPRRSLVRKLNAIIAKDGICREYTDLLTLNCRGDMKNQCLSELAFAYTANGDHDSAKNTLGQVDVVSVLDIARSTGDYCTAAYYYSAAVLTYLASEERGQADEAYENGKFYIEALEKDEFTVWTKAVYLLSAKGKDAAEVFADSIRRKRLSRCKSRLKGCSACVMKAHVLNAIGRRDEAEAAAHRAAECTVSKEAERRVGEILRGLNAPAEAQST
ncbi:MAG: hypothetical protein ACI4JF_01950 [Oscillospiraceae bacterium]